MSGDGRTRIVMRRTRTQILGIQYRLSPSYSLSSSPSLIYNSRGGCTRPPSSPGVTMTTAIRDYSELHTRTGALGRPPATKEDWQQYRLTDDQVQSFHRDGYLTGVQILNDDQVEALRVELTGLM